MSILSGRLLLYAPNLHTGGGLVLLNSIIQAWPSGVQMVAWLDARAQQNLQPPFNSSIKWVKPSLSSRLRAEFTLAKESSKDDRVLCLHSLPPLFSNNGEIIIFHQNRNLLSFTPNTSHARRTHIRLYLEKLIAYMYRHRCSTYWVQTPSMATALEKWYGEGAVNIRVFPFVQTTTFPARNKSPKLDFIYVADGEGHKNHRRLIEAWLILARQGLKPSLSLTLSADRDKSLLEWIYQLNYKNRMQISNLGYLSHVELCKTITQFKAMVFPSINESFGLPLIEAHQADLPIIASELDFVRDVCQPVQTFDPYSPVSIARAVRRFLSKAESPIKPVSASDFLGALIGDI